ncbi:MAG: DUF839 domain-containing protein [Gammaproteobacteria bacterium]|jgi:secreted PhoX family phosphatase|nr:DUF839 domain-containing protein [Gammaproteobacteria bacterium]
MDPDDYGSNNSGNRPFHDVLRTYASRRKILAGGVGAAATGILAPAAMAGSWGNKKYNGWGKPYRKRGWGLMNFEPVPAEADLGTEPTISSDYEYQVLIPWGDPLEPGGPKYDGDPNSRPSSKDQTQMIGIGHDGMSFFPYSKGRYQSNRAGMLCINHEFGRNNHVTGKSFPETLEDVRLSQHAHGVSVVAIANWRNRWRQIRSRNSRRIHVNTPTSFSGPAADSDLLKTPAGNIPLGTVNNCANGMTPWGTYLTCEENFQGYFGASGSWDQTEERLRYGLSENGFGYGWHLFDKRFDMSDPDYRNEEHRFGWVVEIDPWDATQTPVKRTALGRCKHEGSAMVTGRGGRLVAYMGDDERFDYIYKYVSADNWKAMLKQGRSPLDEGILYVAKFHDDGRGEWLQLTGDNRHPALQNWAEDRILVFTRLAADAAGATPMDRPEWTAIGADGFAYCTLTNNSRREEPNPANPLAPNPDGHIIRWKDSDGYVGDTFEWNIFLFGANTTDTEDAFSAPDGIWGDPDGRLFIETDGTQISGTGDDAFEFNDQMLVADINTGEIRRLLIGVNGCEVTGLTTTPDRRTMFCNLQHAGNGDPTATNFPAPTDGVTIPRDATLVIRRKDGGIVGS